MKKIKNVISFVENLLGKLRKLFVNTLTVLFLMLITFGFLFSLGESLFESDKVETEDQILYLEPKGVIVDKAILTNDPFEEFEIFESSINQIELEGFLKIIKTAGTDDDLKAIYLDVDGLSAYYTSALKIADALYEARENGKEIIAFTSGLGTTGYLMASQATEIILEKDTYEPVLPFGFSRVRLYQKDFFENIKVNMNVYAAGDFKSGPEGYTRNDMSETDRFAWLEFITPIWEKYKSKMEIGRGFESGRIQYIGDNYPLLVSENNGDNNETSLSTGLVDKLMSEQETRNYLIEKYGSEEEYERPEGISGREYLSTLKDEDISNKQKRVQEKNKIAIIHLFILGFEDELTNFTLGLTNPSTQADLLKIENWKEKILLYKDAVSDPGNGIQAVSTTWAKKHILGFSDEEIKLDIQQQRIEKAVGAELQKTPEVIIHTGIFDNIDRLYGKKPGEVAAPPAEGGDMGAPPSGDMGSLGGLGGGGGDMGAPPEAPEAPEAPAGGEITPESRMNDLNLILEDDLISGRDEIDLSKGRTSINEIETKLNELLNS